MKTRAYELRARADAVEDTRARIVASARELFVDNWYDDVTLNAIAGAAGVSHQTVLNHFGSKEGVFAAVAAVVEAEFKVRDRAAIASGSEASVRRLLEQYEELGMANVRMVLQEHQVPAMHAVLERARVHHRAWVEEAFAHCLPASGAARRQRIAAFVVATEVMAWKAIRHDYGFSKADTAAAITALVSALEVTP
jgi:AcrR family transcriptional regulator